MKKLFCAVLITVMLWIPMASLWVSAEDMHNGQHFESENTVDFSCRFDAENSRIAVGGTIQHDVWVTHRDYTIEIYAIPPGNDAHDVIGNPDISPVASADIAIRFDFSIEARDILKKYSRYCVVLRSPEGKTFLASQPKYVEIPSTFQYQEGNRSAYKGIMTSQVSLAAGAGSGRIILPIYLDRLLSDVSSSYVYQMGNTNVYFDAAYVNRLDLELRAASAQGAEVYLQFLLPAGTNTATYAMPDVYVTENLMKLEAITAFLSRRYDGTQNNGTFSGIIVGKSVDQASKMNTAGNLSQAEYVDKYVLYVVSVANTARQHLPNTDIVLPFSSENTYGDREYTGEDFSPSALLEEILYSLDHNFSNPFSCTVLIESETLPFSLPTDPLAEGFDLSLTSGDDTVHAGNVEIFSSYLSGLRDTYESAPTSFMYVWSVPFSLRGNSLDAVYAYSYFRMITEPTLASFVVSFDAQEQSGVSDGYAALSHIYTYIDTDQSEAVTETVRSYLGLSRWADIHTKEYQGNYRLRDLYEKPCLFDLPHTMAGQFAYFDFSTSVNLNTWFAGNACQGIRLDYSSLGGKALQMNMTAPDSTSYAEAFCLYEYPENFIYTPYLAVRLSITAKDSENASALYEVVVTAGTGKDRLISKNTLAADKMGLLVVDMSAYNQAHMAEYLKISVRPLNGGDSDFLLWIYDIVGYSPDLNSEELKLKIEEERRRIRNLGNEEDDGDGDGARWWTIVGIAVFVVVIGIGVFVFIRQRDDEKQEDGTPPDT